MTTSEFVLDSWGKLINLRNYLVNDLVPAVRQAQNRILEDATALSIYNGSRNQVMLQNGRRYMSRTSSAVADNVMVIVDARNESKRWLAQFDGPLQAVWFGVKADGVTNDLPAIQAALNFAFANGIARVQMPPGRYKLAGSTSITVPNGVKLLGTNSIPTNQLEDRTYCFDIYIGENEQDNSVALVDAFIVLPLSGFEGFSFYYPNQPKTATTPTPYGWTITTRTDSGGQDGIQLKNLMLINPYEAIRLDYGSQHDIENIHGQPIKRGLFVNRAYDVARYKDIHFWPFFTRPGENLFDWISKNGTAYHIAHIDGGQFSNIFSYGYKRGILFDTAGAGGSWVSMNNVLIDVSDHPIVINDLYKIQITNLTVTGLTVATSQDGILINASVNNLGASLEINGFEAVNFTTGIRNKGVLRANISGTSKVFYENQNNGVRWFEVVNENIGAEITYNSTMPAGDRYRRIAGRVSVNGAENFTSLTDITPSGFATPHTWPLTSGPARASAITGGSNLNVGTTTTSTPSDLTVRSFPIPQQVLDEHGLFVFQFRIKAHYVTGVNVVQFYMRLRDYSRPPAIEYPLVPIGTNGFFFEETLIQIPFVFSGTLGNGVIDLIYGINITNEPISFDLTDVKLYKAEGYSTSFIENMPKHQGYLGKLYPSITEPAFATTLSETLNVKNFGAKGNGVSDDTQAFQKAVNAALRFKIRVVEVPFGNYLITSTVTIPQGVILQGVLNKSAYKTVSNSDIDSINLYIKTPQGETVPAFLISYNGGIRNFTFFWPDQVKTASTPLAYGWAISTNGLPSNGDGILIENIMFTNGYKWINFDFGGQATIRNIQGHPLKIGIWVDRMFDTSRITDIHFWPFWAGTSDPIYSYIQNNAVGLLVGRADGLQVNNLFGYGLKHGVHEIYSNHDDYNVLHSGAAWAQYTNVSFDFCIVPMQIDRSYYTQVTNMTGTCLDARSGHALIETGPDVAGDVILSNLTGWHCMNLVKIKSNTGRFQFTNLQKQARVDANDVFGYKIINEGTADVQLDSASYFDVSGRVKIGSLIDFPVGADVTPTDFATPHGWFDNPGRVTAITGGSSFNMLGSEGVAVKLPIPENMVIDAGVYLMEFDVKLNNPQNFTGTFYFRLSDNTINDFLFPPAPASAFFPDKTRIRVPFIIRSPGQSFQFVFGGAASACSVEITNLKIKQINWSTQSRSMIEWVHLNMPNGLNAPLPLTFSGGSFRHLDNGFAGSIDMRKFSLVSVAAFAGQTIVVPLTNLIKGKTTRIKRYHNLSTGTITVTVPTGQIQNSAGVLSGSSVNFSATDFAIDFTFDGTNTQATPVQQTAS